MNAAKNPNTMYRSILSFPLIAAAIATNAQTTVHQVVILNEGHYDFMNQVQDVPVSLGTYDPITGLYNEMVIIPDARFGNSVQVENELIYVSADSFLLKYDANTFALLDQEVVTGIRRIAIWNDQLLITLGEVGGLPHYFEVRDKNTFDLVYTIDPADGLIHSTEAIEVVNDKAYISITNGFDWPNYDNKVGVLDLATGTYGTEIDLGPDGYNPEHLMVVNGDLYAFNNKDYTGSSISKIDPVAGSLTYTTNVALSSGCGTSAATADHIYYLEYAISELARFDLATGSVLDTLANGLNAYGTLNDPINNVLYVTTTDYVSSGTLHVTAYDGTELSNVAIGVAAGKMALDLRLSTGIDHAIVPALAAFPNPSSEHITVTGAAAGTAYEATDAQGRVIARGQLSRDLRLDVSAWEAGSYALRITDASGSTVVRIQKR